MEIVFYVVSILLWFILLYFYLKSNNQKTLYAKNKISRINKLNTAKYFAVFIDVCNLYKYSQFYDIKISSNIFSSIYIDLKKKYGKHNVYLYATNQIVILLPFSSDVNDLELYQEEQKKIAKEIIEYIENNKYFINDFQYYRASLRLGVGSSGAIIKDYKIEDIIKIAQFAMLKAKEQNKKYLVADEALRLVKQDLDCFYKEMEKGFLLDQFSPFFIPIVDPKTMKIAGCESLVRWRKDKYREIEASKFFDIALEKNLFDKIDKRVMEKTFQSYLGWTKLNLINKDFFIALNLTVKSLMEIDIEKLLLCLKDYSLKPENIEFDISFYDDLREKEIEKIKELKRSGFKIAYDEKNLNISFNLLNNIQFDKIKLKNIALRYENDFKIIRILIGLSSLFKYSTMAKCIEDKKDFEIVKKLNIDFAEGYYFSKPVDADSFEQFLFKYKNGIS